MALSHFDSNELITLYRRCVDRCLPFWYEHGVDHELGGFFGDVQDDGSLGSDVKGGWYQGFGIWLFAHFHNEWDGDARYLEAARRGWRFMAAHGRDGDGCWVMTLSREGNAIEGATSILTDAYLAHGLVELYKADRDNGYLDVARQALIRVGERIQSPDFCLSAPSYTEPHSLNGAWSTVLLPVSDFLGLSPDDSGLLEISDLCLHAVLDKHLDAETGLIIEALAPDGTAYTGTQCDVVKPGAAAESCAAIMIEADRRGDRALRTRAVEVLRSHLETCWDPEYGGIFYETDLRGNPVTDRKDAWAQAEFMRALMLARTTEKNEWIAEGYERIHEWAFSTYATESDDLWRLSASREGQLLENRKLDMVHHPRMLLTILRILETEKTF